MAGEKIKEMQNKRDYLEMLATFRFLSSLLA